MNRKEYLLILLLILMPLITMASLIYRYGIDIPYWDYWELVPLLHKLHFGKLTFYDLWRQHNEHRIFFPKIIMLTLAYLSNWNIWYELWTSFIFNGGILFFLYLLLSYTFDVHNKRLILYLTAVFSFLIFSPAQWLNYIQAFQLQIFLVVLSKVIVVWSLQRWYPYPKGILIAIIAAVIGSYSFAAGIPIWISSVILLLLKSKINWKYVILWFFSAGITIILYFYKFTKPEKSFLSFINHPFYFFGYVLTYIGAPLSFENKYVALIIGLFLIVTLVLGTIIIWRYYKEFFDFILPWLSFALYVLLNAIITGIGRMEDGKLYQALSSHYTTISTLFVISVFVITIICIENYLKENRLLPTKLVILLSSVGTLLILSYILTFSYGVNKMQNRWGIISLAKYCLFSQDKCDYWKILYPDEKILKERIKILKQIPF